MALSNLFGWNKKTNTVAYAACGTACGAGDEPKTKVAASTACGASDGSEQKPSACGSACGAGDK